MGILTISRWELRRTSLSFSRKLIALSLLLIILTGFVSLYVSQNGFHINDGMYRVIVTDPALAEVLKTDYKFQVYIAQEEQAKELYERGDTGSILLLVSVTAVIIVLLGAIIAVRYRDRAISQYLYSLILIPLFLSVYLFANSPFNLVARLSTDAIGAEILTYIGLYAALAVLLYIGAKKAIGRVK